MLLFIWLAAIMSGLTFSVHFFVGGRKVAGPLLEDRSLPRASKWLNYYCWHVTSVLLIFFIAGFVWLAIHPDVPSLVFLSALSFALSGLSAWVACRAGIPAWRFPSTSLFAAIAVLGTVSVLVR